MAIPALITVLDKGETQDAAPAPLAPSSVEPDTGDTGAACRRRTTSTTSSVTTSR